MGLSLGPSRIDERPTIWIHAVSVGEFNVARTLIPLLQQEMPTRRIVVSTTTLTGQQLALNQRPTEVESVFYFPFDWVFSVRRVLDHVRPELVVIMETELWPNFLRQCRKRAIHTVIANGRISPRSFESYRKLNWFISQVTNDVSLMLMQSDEDADRAKLLGAPADRVIVTGNLKYDAVVVEQAQCDKLFDSQFGLGPDQRLIIAGSTAAGEEKLLLSALTDVRNSAGLSETTLLIAPRRPERFDEVADLIVQSGFNLLRRSETKKFPTSESASTPGNHRTPDVILLDTIGELSNIYSIADVVFIGGSLVPHGGHNVIEAALYSKPIIVGPHNDNFRQIVSDFQKADALVKLDDSDVGSLSRELINLLRDRARAKAMGERARAILSNGRGATERTVAAIKLLLSTNR
jgi:3-deoxy-D-manno-octulosonic-acid transferase